MQIRLGAFAKPLHKQLDVPSSKVKTEQALVDAYIMLRVHGIITDGEATKIATRIIKQIDKTLDT